MLQDTDESQSVFMHPHNEGRQLTVKHTIDKLHINRRATDCTLRNIAGTIACVYVLIQKVVVVNMPISATLFVGSALMSLNLADSAYLRAVADPLTLWPTYTALSLRATLTIVSKSFRSGSGWEPLSLGETSAVQHRRVNTFHNECATNGHVSYSTRPASILDEQAELFRANSPPAQIDVLFRYNDVAGNWLTA